MAGGIAIGGGVGTTGASAAGKAGMAGIYGEDGAIGTGVGTLRDAIASCLLCQSSFATPRILSIAEIRSMKLLAYFIGHMKSLTWLYLSPVRVPL